MVTTVTETPKVSNSRTKPPETRFARNRRITLQALRAGCRISSVLGNRFDVSSRRSLQMHEVHLLEDGPVETWICDDRCGWFAFHGDLEIYNSGTLLQTKNDVLPCAHVLIARLWHMGALKRADLFSEDAELADAWRSAHLAPVDLSGVMG